MKNDSKNNMKPGHWRFAYWKKVWRVEPCTKTDKNWGL